MYRSIKSELQEEFLVKIRRMVDCKRMSFEVENYTTNTPKKMMEKLKFLDQFHVYVRSRGKVRKYLVDFK